MKIKNVLKGIFWIIAGYFLWIVSGRFARGYQRPRVEFGPGDIVVTSPKKKPAVTNAEIDRELEKLR